MANLTSYTHRQWRFEAQDLVADIAGLHAALEHMRAGLQYVEAGATQRREQTRWVTLAADLAERGRRVLEAHDPRLTRVSQAQAAAGGEPEVAKRKRYNQ